jgi:protein gp37
MSVHSATVPPREARPTTWNPTTGCDRTSPGCDRCYALNLARRLKAMGQPKYQRDGDSRTSGPGFRLTLHPDTLAAPTRWARPREVFVDSMSDLFHPDVPDAFIAEVFEVMAATPRHRYQVLTKRSHRLAEIAHRLPWPSNVWIGVSVETDKHLFRLDHLRMVPATVRFLSAEPLLGPLGTVDLTGIGWVIASGESGVGARPVALDWIRALRDQSQHGDIPFFFKQWGGRSARAGGRTLDGRTWDQTPTCADTPANPSTATIRTSQKDN